MGKIDEVHQPENHREADRKEEQQHRELQAVQKLNNPKATIGNHVWTASSRLTNHKPTNPRQTCVTALSRQDRQYVGYMAQPLGSSRTASTVSRTVCTTLPSLNSFLKM